MREGSSLVRPMSNLRISYWALYSMILSKIADRWPESIRCPSASIVSWAGMGAHSSGACGGTVRAGSMIRRFAVRGSGSRFGVEVHMARRAVVRLGVPALIVALLAIVALWRVGPPPQQQAGAVGTTGTGAGKALTIPIKTVAELISNNSIGREASLEHVRIRERAGDRFFWIGSGDERPVFVVLDP